MRKQTRLRPKACEANTCITPTFKPSLNLHYTFPRLSEEGPFFVPPQASDEERGWCKLHLFENPFRPAFMGSWQFPGWLRAYLSPISCVSPHPLPSPKGEGDSTETVVAFDLHWSNSSYEVSRPTRKQPKLHMKAREANTNLHLNLSLDLHFNLHRTTNYEDYPRFTAYCQLSIDLSHCH